MVAAAIRIGQMAVLKQESSRVQGIVAGNVLRRLVCKAVAKQYSEAFMTATAPFQFAMQTRAGTEALAHILQYVTDRDPEVVIMSLDGVGAFDHVRRAAFLNASVGLWPRGFPWGGWAGGRPDPRGVDPTLVKIRGGPTRPL